MLAPVVVLLTIGCASRPKIDPGARNDAATAAPVRLAQVTEDGGDGSGGASALAFDPPVAPAESRALLARAGRSPSAFVGYEQVTTTHFYTRYDDRQLMPDRDGGWLERRSISVTSGVRYR